MMRTAPSVKNERFGPAGNKNFSPSASRKSEVAFAASLTVRAIWLLSDREWGRGAGVVLKVSTRLVFDGD